VLRKGLKFCVTPTRLPLDDIVPALVQVSEKLPQKKGEQFRSQVVSFLRRVPLPRPNLSREESLALKELSKVEGTFFQPADKERSCVIWNEAQHDARAYDHINSGPYQKISGNPVPRVTIALSRKLNKMHKEGQIPKYMVSMLQVSDPLCPRFYNLAKTHKVAEQGCDTPPGRPINSQLEAVLASLSLWLTKVFSPLSKKSKYSLRNGYEFVQSIRGLELHEDEIFASLDVKALYPSVPIEDALLHCTYVLDQDQRFSSRPTTREVSKAGVMELLRFCLNNSYFQFRGDYYRQVEGGAMGVGIVAIVADLFMESLEDRALSRMAHPPRMWKRYVDDCWAVIRADYFEDMFTQMNKQHGNIKFTKEHAKNNQLGFLDALAVCKGREVSTTVYRKPTHTDQYLNYNSNHPQRHKASVVWSLATRAFLYCDTEDELQAELKHVKTALAANGYPAWFVNWHIKKAFLRITNKEAKGDKKEGQLQDKDQITISLPYINGFSEQLGKLCKPFGVTVLHRPYSSIRSHLRSAKDRLLPSQKRNVVYSIPCQNCDKVYIGETGRQECTRMKEHKRNILVGSQSSGPALHCKDGHQMDWEGVKHLAREPNMGRRKIIERIKIHQSPNNFCIVEQQRDIHPEWFTVYQREDARLKNTQHKAHRPRDSDRTEHKPHRSVQRPHHQAEEGHV